MSTWKTLVPFFIIFLIVAGCNTDDTGAAQKKGTPDNPCQQDEAVEAKVVLNQMDAFIEPRAVSCDEEVFATAKVKQMNRLKIPEHTKEALVELDEKLPHSELHFSTDQKVWQLLDDLETDTGSEEMQKSEIRTRLLEVEDHIRVKG
ncbi:hypothetical protein [Salsuginibacillus kocurii]|uniref:hypothetical protein n=1 Tax=Salsuginibacillus kocurii TaxID=427078 RepID=UPI00037FE7AC|nr:hypothetical protein [Salsuginibacillus kocurii]